MSQPILSIARKWVNMGIAVIPVRYRSKKPLVKWEPYQNHLPTEQELIQWFPSSLRNLALVVGNGLVVIDFDVMEVFDYWRSVWGGKTYMVKTQRGVHVYVKTQEQVKNYHSCLLDIKAERGYVLVPPSVHPSGFEYQVFQDAPILEIQKLEDILPAEFLPEPEKVILQTVQDEIQDVDAWELADSAIAIQKDAVQTIRQNVSLLSLLKDVQSSSSDGRWFIAPCPFHDDANPSFWIDTARGICGCRKCNIKEMDVIDLFARIHKISNRDAILWLSRL